MQQHDVSGILPKYTNNTYFEGSKYVNRASFGLLGSPLLEVLPKTNARHDGIKKSTGPVLFILAPRDPNTPESRNIP